MNISYFAEFVALSESLNFSATASQLSISQPALSNHIQALEEELGVKLFERTRRSVALTKEGRLLLADARNLLDQYTDMHRFSQKNLADNCIFTVGGWLESPIVMSQLATSVRRFHDASGVQLKMMSVQGYATNMAEELNSGKIDFIAAHRGTFPAESNEPLDCLPFCTDCFAIAVTSENPMAGKGEITMEDLAQLTFIHLTGPGFEAGWNQVVAACEEAGFTPRERPVFMESATETSMLDLADSECFVFSFGGLANGMFFAGRPDLTVVPVRSASFKVDLFYKEANLHPTLRQFVEFLKG
ncbi:LysR family transcriptional regulator [Parvibacter caecicola]|uniref:LysR family transcriptional regulator n=1 Tax=Parvibacter caecicola TaxID=747645 RepID=UPI0027314601|nr:LysR family transcriptional regulator [Parvibacter caecicola]